MRTEIADVEVLLRGVLPRDLYWDRQSHRLHIGVQAFMLRKTDEARLSVYRQALETPDRIFARLPRSEVLVAVTAGGIRRLGLQVEAAGRRGNPGHALILGLPEPSPNRPESAEHRQAVEMAGELLKIARPVAYRSGSLESLSEKLIDEERFTP